MNTKNTNNSFVNALFALDAVVDEEHRRMTIKRMAAGRAAAKARRDAEYASYVYCPMCDKEVRFTCEDEETPIDFDGNRYVFKCRKALCDECGEELKHIPVVAEYNLRSFYNAAKKQMENKV